MSHCFVSIAKDFNKDTASFGTIKKGDTAFVGFAFVNSGKLPLKILDVSASCGCTKPRYDSAKIYKPGEDGIIEIGYYSKVDTGNILKNLVVKTNSETMLKVLYIRGFVQ